MVMNGKVKLALTALPMDRANPRVSHPCFHIEYISNDDGDASKYLSAIITGDTIAKNLSSRQHEAH